jgi:hypothetical protein
MDIRAIMKQQLVSLLLLLPLGGCAFMTHDVKVAFTLQGPVTTDLGSVKEKIRVGVFVDNRGNANPRMIIHETNGYGQTTSGGWQAEKPIADIVRDAVLQCLLAAHAPMVDSSETLLLTGEVEDYRYRFDKQFWSGTVYAMLTVKLRMRDVNSGETVWTKVIVGTGSYHGSFMPATEALFRSALDDLATKILSEQGVSGALLHLSQRQ